MAREGLSGDWRLGWAQGWVWVPLAESGRRWLSQQTVHTGVWLQHTQQRGQWRGLSLGVLNTLFPSPFPCVPGSVTQASLPALNTSWWVMRSGECSKMLWFNYFKRIYKYRHSLYGNSWWRSCSIWGIPNPLSPTYFILLLVPPSVTSWCTGLGPSPPIVTRCVDISWKHPCFRSPPCFFSLIPHQIWSILCAVPSGPG